MSPSLFTLVIFLFCAGWVAADTDNHGVTFLYPTSNLTFNYKDTVNVSYTSNFSSPQLFTFCTPEGSNTIITKLVQTTIPPYNGSSLVALEWTNATTCWFDLRPNSTAGHGANSPSFSLLSTAHSPAQTFSLAHPNGIPPNHSPSRIAIIVAITTTSILLSITLFVLAFCFWRKRNAKKNGYIRTNVLQAQYIDQVDQKWHPGGNGAAGEYVYVKPMQSYGDFKKDKRVQKPAELPVEERPVELGGYPIPAARPFGEGEKYEPTRYEGQAAEPVANPRKQNRFSWQPSLRFG